MQTIDEIETYIKLKYSSNKITKEYLQLLPIPVLNKLYNKIFRPRTFPPPEVVPYYDQIDNIRIYFIRVSKKPLVEHYLKEIHKLLIEYYANK